MKNLIIIFGLLIVVSSCNKVSKHDITHPEDYEVYLNDSIRSAYQEAVMLKDFWSKRLRPDSSGVGDLAPLAGAYERLFEFEGNPEYLIYAENLYQKGLHISAMNRDYFARGLAHNYISQHRFQEAYELLQLALDSMPNKRQTRLMLFDAAMEVGDYDKAYEYLGAVKNMSDYNYLIRLSKWSDYRGDLDNAINYMEQAAAIATSRDSKPLMIWTQSNLADYYGHAGRIEDSYENYLLTLALQPDNAYALKGIAWVAFSGERNTEDAHRILDQLMVHSELPDYALLKSELYAFDKDEENARKWMDRYVSKIEGNPAFGAMYNGYLIEYYAETDPKKALELAQQEVSRRATPETYHLLALAQLKSGQMENALNTIDQFVEGKTSEPMALYHSALVYKANGNKEKTKALKKELKEASYELGPNMAASIKKL